ncbi:MULTISPECIES: hypothetical protein [Myroides]|uniref:YD repeat-containing protein n=1 Tax=Myroides albus TaxID=2562892 RepID=A0A6I3LCW0_9FLAO|nr:MULTISPECIES: hypothetical protein [Myroides]MTG97299.1 hypothetical protein [Myroides albus]MVX37166.1 hypothetical protein [Myroides sp. LoEW2-1]UVD80614.1 hypothetical protein NWE55_05000 [Myroides albus]
MKKLVLLLLLISVASCKTEDSKVQNDLQVEGLQGKVKTYTKITTDLQKFETQKSVYHFNTDGFITSVEGYLVVQEPEVGNVDLSVSKIDYEPYKGNKRELKVKGIEGVSPIISTEEWNSNNQLITYQKNGDFISNKIHSFNDKGQLLSIESNGTVSDIAFNIVESYYYNDDNTIQKVIREDRDSEQKREQTYKVWGKDKEGNPAVLEKSVKDLVVSRVLYEYEYYE